MPDRDPMLREIIELRTLLDEREKSAGTFRGELRDWFNEIKHAINVHAAEDTRRFEQADTKLDIKVGEIYTYMERTAAEKLRHSWQVAGVVITFVSACAAILIALHKTGAL